MSSLTKLGVTAVVAAFLMLGLIASPCATRAGAAVQSDASLPSPSSVAKPQAYVSLEQVPAGHEFEVAIVVDILTGYHMNSHKPTESYLIPTSISLATTPGIREVSTSYPDGQMLKFDFSQGKLSVYSGSVTIRAKLAADAAAPPGEVTLPYTLRYQACNMSACLPPAKISVPVKVKIAPADTKPHAIHPEIFKKSAS
jgi:DsbC/DsbD-like thiol-disulfide interchange protein